MHTCEHLTPSVIEGLSTQRRESNPRPFGPKPNTPTTTPHFFEKYLDLLFGNFGLNLKY